MNAPYRILIPLDGSSEAEGILSSTLPLLRQSAVTLLSVVPNSASAAQGRKYLAGVRESLLREGIHAETLVTWGEPVREILFHAGPQERDLVAMSTHGRTGLQRVFMGSVASAVVHECPVALLIGRPEVEMSGWKQMVVGLDGSPRAERILESALPLARILGSTLHLLAVEEEGVPCGDADYLRRIAARLEAQDIPTVTAVRSGKAAREILRYRDESRAGLIALATHGRTGLGRVLMGSVAEEVVRSTSCLVLLKPVVQRPVPIEAGSAAGGVR